VKAGIREASSFCTFGTQMPQVDPAWAGANLLAIGWVPGWPEALLACKHAPGSSGQAEAPRLRESRFSEPCTHATGTKASASRPIKRPHEPRIPGP